MARSANLVQSEKITMMTTPQVRSYLEELVAGGLYGKNVAEAADRLIAQAIERLVRDGAIKRLPAKKS